MTQCLYCHRPVSSQLTLLEIWRWQPLTTPVLCPTCAKQFQPIGPQHCPNCGRPQASLQPCVDCIRWGDRLVNHALFPYEGALAAYLQQYKFQGDYELRRVVQPWLRQALAAETYDVLVPIPITVTTWQTRGFNQVTGWLTDQPYEQALIAQPKTTPQSHKNRQERLASPQPFTLRPQMRPRLTGRRVLLLDDVYTTGRTLRHAANQIYFGGAKAVTSRTLAR